MVLGLPLPIDKKLVGLETRFVIHFWTALDPVAQVQKWKPQVETLINLPHHTICSIVCMGVGVVEGVHG